MKLYVLISNSWGTINGGINSFNYDLCLAVGRYLINSKHRIVCVVLKASTDEIAKAQNEYNVSLISLNKNTEEYDDPCVEAILYKLLNENKICDKVYFVGHDIKTGFIAKKCKDIAKNNSLGKEFLFAVFHHMDYSSYESIKPTTEVKKLFEKLQLQNEIINSADIVFGVGPKLTESAQSKSSHRENIVEIIPGLHDLSVFPVPKTFSAITFGRFNPGIDRIKQFKLAIAAFAMAQSVNSNPLGFDSKLNIFGVESEFEQKQLETFVQNYSDRIIPMNALPYETNRQKLFDSLSKNSVCMMLSFHEGFGLVAWEAIAAEVPLIISKNSGVYKLIDNEFGGSGIGNLKGIDIHGTYNDNPEKNDIDNVANEILDINKDQVKWKSNAKSLKKLLLQRGFTWENTAKTFLDGLDGSKRSSNEIENDAINLIVRRKTINLRIIHPLPPAPYFVGRKNELNKLFNWWDSNKPCLISLIGIGGAGKTAITSHFLRKLLSEENKFQRKIKYCFVWSFYIDQDINTLVNEAYDYFSDGSDLNCQGSGAIYKLINLLETCNNGLIIFDGLERVQKPFSDKNGQFGELEDYLFKILIRRIAQGVGNIMCIVTSRFVLSDTDVYRHYSFYNIDINYLEREDAILLFRYHKINATINEIDDFFNKFGRHALLLDHACIFISEFCNCVLKKFEEFKEPDFESDIREERKLAKIFKAYETVLKKEELDLLIRLCIFRFGISLDNLYTFFSTANKNIAGNLSGLSIIDLKKILNRLVKLHLVLNESEHYYTTHPALKDHFYHLFVNIQNVHKHASEFYSRLADKPGPQLPNDKKIIDYFEELIFHLISANAEDAAKDFYQSKLGGVVHLGQCLGEYSRGLRILNAFSKYPFNEDRAIYLFQLGQISQSLEFAEYPKILAAGSPHNTIRFAILFLLGELPKLKEKSYSKLDMSVYHQVNLLLGDKIIIDKGRFNNTATCCIQPILAHHLPHQTKIILPIFHLSHSTLNDTKDYREKVNAILIKAPDRSKIQFNSEKVNWYAYDHKFDSNGTPKEIKQIVQELNSITRDYIVTFRNEEVNSRQKLSYAEIDRINGDLLQCDFNIESVYNWIYNSGSQELMCVLHLTKGRLYESSKKFDKMYFELKQAILIAQNCKFGLYYIEILNQFSLYYLHQNNYDIAELIALSALQGNAKFKIELENKNLEYLAFIDMFGSEDANFQYIWGKIESYYLLGKINLALRKFDKAKEYLTQCHKMQEKVKHYNINKTKLLLFKLIGI